MNQITHQSKRAAWLRHVSAWRSTPLTQAAYCREHNLNATTFNAWVTRDRQASLPTRPLTLVPLRIQPPTPTPSPTSPPLTLQHRNGWQLNLPVDVQVSWLAQLLRALP